jgi:hypothetical protein
MLFVQAILHTYRKWSKRQHFIHLYERKKYMRTEQSAVGKVVHELRGAGLLRSIERDIGAPW